MENCLVRYFSLNKECPLPGIGSLISKESSAVLDIIDKKIQAPTTTVVFSKDELEETSLLRYIQAEYNCDASTAQKKLVAFVKKIKALDKQESISLGALGSLQKNSVNQLELIPFKNLANYHKEIPAYRLVKLNAPHAILVGDKETTREAMQEFYVEKSTAFRSRWWIAAIIILVISAALIFTHYFYFNGNSSFGNHLGF
jgi:hypothetical protein